MKQMNKRRWRSIATVAILFGLIPLVVALGIWLFANRRYNLISMAVAFLSCLPFLLRFEKGRSGAREMVVIAVLSAFSVVGRLIFTPIPGFQPVTAITVIAGIALGGEAGFLVGSMTAIVSNLFYGQGPWTPFQMLAWGMIGFVSGILLRRKESPNRILLSLIGGIGGVLYSLLMDVWTTLSVDGELLLSRYLTHVAAGLNFMLIYAVSNVVFLLALAKPFLEKLNRIKRKYGIFL